MEEGWNIMDMGYKEGRKWCTRKKMHVIDEDPCRMHGGVSQHIVCQPQQGWTKMILKRWAENHFETKDGNLKWGLDIPNNFI